MDWLKQITAYITHEKIDVNGKLYFMRQKKTNNFMAWPFTINFMLSGVHILCGWLLNYFQENYIVCKKIVVFL